MLLTIMLMWLLVGITVNISPAIKWHALIIGGVATFYILILYAGRLPKQRKFRILGPLRLDGNGIYFSAKIRDEVEPLSIRFDQLRSVKYYRETFIAETAGTKYRFQRICFDDADAFRRFRESVGAGFDRINGKAGK